MWSWLAALAIHSVSVPLRGIDTSKRVRDTLSDALPLASRRALAVADSPTVYNHTRDSNATRYLLRQPSSQRLCRLPILHRDPSLPTEQDVTRARGHCIFSWKFSGGVIFSFRHWFPVRTRSLTLVVEAPVRVSRVAAGSFSDNFRLF